MTEQLRRACACGCLAMALMLLQAPLAAQDSVPAARDLYAAARYEDALAMLARLNAATMLADDGRAAGQYRALCLLALGKTAEASQVIDAVIAGDPSYRPSDSEVSPRVRSVFSDARKRLLPGLVQEKYAQAKMAFERKEYPAASAGFAELVALFADPDLAGAVERTPLADLRLLVDGFYQLSAKAAAPPPAPEPPPQPARPVVAPVPSPPKIYTASDASVVPPIVVHQELPRFSGVVLRPLVGAMEVVIDETGKVTSAAMREPVMASYDREAIAAAQGWRYRPAVLDGTPVKYRKLIQVSVTAQ